MTARKATGLLSLGGPETPAPVPPFNLDVARLLPVLPPLEGDTELVALATLLRARALGEVACLTMLAWEQVSPEERESGDAERTLRAKWREMVAALLTPREADWWLRHGCKGYGAAVHAVATLDVKSA